MSAFNQWNGVTSVTTANTVIGVVMLRYLTNIEVLLDRLTAEGP